MDQALGPAKWTEVVGIQTRFFVQGTGAPVIFIHGGEIGAPEASADQWRDCVAPLARGFRAVAFDRIGMGHSGFPLADEDYTLAVSGRHALAFVKAHAEGPVHLVAHGSGARIAFDLCFGGELTIASCIILNSATVTPGVLELVPRRTTSGSWTVEQQAREHYRSLYAPHSRIDPALVREASVIAELDTIKRAHAKMWDGDLRSRVYMRDLALGRGAIFKRLGEQAVGCPMLLINGSEDPLVDAECATLLVSAIAAKQEDIELRLLANCGHYPQLEQSAIVAGIIAGFVRQHTRAGA